MNPGNGRSDSIAVTTNDRSPAYLPSGPSSGTVSIASPSSSDPFDILSTLVNRNFQFTSDLHLHDLELMHHYTTRTYRTLSNNNEHKEIWKTVIPKEALAHPFLMHGLLALAALHLVECSGDEGEGRRMYAELATRHQNLALASFRPELNNITSSNCNAVFAFSSLIAVFAFAFSQSAGNKRTAEPISEVLQDFFLFRGVEGVLKTSWDSIEKGKLGPLVRRASDSGSTVPIPQDTIDALDYLHECNADSVTHIPTDEK